MRITLFDNHDSFTWNLAHDLGRFGWSVSVVREGAWMAIVGPKPTRLCCPRPWIARRARPIDGRHGRGAPQGCADVGVCLGMQALAVHAEGHYATSRSPCTAVDR